MKTLLLALILAGLSSASPISIEERQNSGVGNGPFAPAGFYTTNSFGGHTFYAPKTVPSGTKLPVLLWGNGGCSADATGQAPFLTQLASHGILVIASGTPGGGGSTTADIMKQSIDFITKNAGQGKYGIIGGHWVQWILRGNSSPSAYMTGSGARNDGWSVVSADLDKLSVTPIGEGSGGGGSPTTTSSTPQPTGGNGGNGGGSCSGLWGQCGGQGWAGPTCCSQGTCKASNQWYSQCLN
ncbi:hypothetical protein C8A01DRAFT_39454 [Parachaetomium inaequale]|uniref:CBM1 domain-containing protein n=1 Tax=Parachaetomium inaequale TaxID=2588326 RepID=A0AAN6SNF3_9PEZI|nr:hypothetical protein C8A01DRAFT_39454 [Parachaetomium inaequale]